MTATPQVQRPPILVLAVVLAVAACAPAAAPAGKPAPAAPSGGSAPVPAPAAPAAAAAPAAVAGSGAEWEQTVAAAKREGVLVLSGPPGDLWRQALLGFEQDYPEIKVEFTGISARDFWPKVMQERQADQFLWDLRVGGADPDAYARKREGVLDPVRPLLLLPEVLDDSKWLGGLDSIFSDEERQYTPGFLANASSLASVNRDVVPVAELASSRDLVQPQWKGKIATDDPRGGSGQGSLATMLYAYGEDWVRTLLTQQDIVVTGNGRQLAEWVVRARYPIGIGIGVTDLVAFHDQGLGRNVHYLGGAQSMSMGFGGIMVLNRRPHPAATTVFVNWLLTRATQERLAPMLRVNSRRTDVAPGNPDQALDPSRLDEYFPQQWERHGAMRERAGQLARELIK